MDKSKNLIIIIILLVIIIGGVSFYAFRQNQENKEMTELFAIEKEEMENEIFDNIMNVNINITVNVFY